MDARSLFVSRRLHRPRLAGGGCGHGFFQTAEREPWRAEAEVACLKSGAVKESLEVVRIDPISGPGVCGAEYPLKVAAFGEGPGFVRFHRRGYAPARQYRGNQPRWPVAAQPPPASYQPAFCLSAPRRSTSQIIMARLPAHRSHWLRPE